MTRFSQCRVGDQSILYDESLWRTHPLELFEHSSECPVSACGRGGTRFVRHGELGLVHKQYRRGGLYRHLVRESYLFTSLETTRMWREFRLLAEMHKHHLPVPQPVAVRCLRRGLIYRGDLITREIPGARPLPELLTDAPLESGMWRAIGHTLRVFHDRGINHADLNAGNILLDEQGRVWLVDFDKGCELRGGSECWKQRNLARLLRSLVKNRRQQGEAGQFFHFSQEDWRTLQLGYEGLRRPGGVILPAPALR